MITVITSINGYHVVASRIDLGDRHRDVQFHVLLGIHSGEKLTIDNFIIYKLCPDACILVL